MTLPDELSMTSISVVDAAALPFVQVMKMLLQVVTAPVGVLTEYVPACSR